MIDLFKLADEAEDVDWDNPDLQKTNEINFLVRNLVLITEKYNRTFQELENIKEVSGFNKEFPFLRLPREIRDRIYAYSLRRHTSSMKRPNSSKYTSLHSYLRTCRHQHLATGLLTTNKLVYTEAVEVLYSQTKFVFAIAGKFLEFENQIGPINRDFIRSIEIHPHIAEWAGSPENVEPKDLSDYDSHWAKALKLSLFKNLNHIVVSGRDEYDMFLVEMPEFLQNSIEDLVARQDQRDDPPRLTLRGFEPNVVDQFPKSLVVVREVTAIDIALQKEIGQEKKKE